MDFYILFHFYLFILLICHLLCIVYIQFNSSPQTSNQLLFVPASVQRQQHYCYDSLENDSF
jgi:hypothetical protein